MVAEVIQLPKPQETPWQDLYGNYLCSFSNTEGGHLLRESTAIRVQQEKQQWRPRHGAAATVVPFRRRR